MRALNTITKNHRTSARIQNKSHFCTDMKEQITLLHGYEKCDRSRVGIVIEKQETIYQRANGKSQGRRGRRTARTHSCVARDSPAQSKQRSSRKSSTRSGVYTDVHEQHARRLTQKKSTTKVVLLFRCLNAPDYLLLNWGALRALCKPYFLRSFALGSRVR